MKLCTLIAATLLAGPLAALASGGDGDYDDSIYVPPHRVPPAEFDGYAAGRLGVVSGEYYRVYRVLAWRALHGAVLTPAQAVGLEINDWRVGPLPNAGDTGVDTWSSARALIAPPDPATSTLTIEVMGPDFGSYVNCTPDGLQRAALTARDRLQRHGTAAARTWLAGQDAVFANCAPASFRDGQGWRRLDPILPPPPPADAPAWLQADRAYQTAAALFYAGKNAEARERFLAIAADKRSAWQPLGAYLAARCLIRQATLLRRDPKDAAQSAEAKRLLTQARAELLALAPGDAAAGRLVGWVEARLRPAERAAELAHALQTGPIAGPDRVAMLSDYLRLMDAIDDADALAEAAEPMTAWIGLMQSAARPEPTAVQHNTVQRLARERWLADGDAAWLMPIVIQARQLGELRPDELKAARAAPSSSPGWQTLHWHLLRLALVSAQTAEVDASIDAVLADTTLAPSTRNRWLQLKLASARSVEAMLAAAPRTQVQGAAAVPIPDEGKPSLVRAVDGDFGRRLYRYMPLSRLAELGERPEFPPTLRTSHLELVFARALMLEDWRVADRLADRIAAPRTTTQALYRRYLAATSPRDKRIAAALILVNTPELNPGAVDSSGYTRYWGCTDHDAQNLEGGADPLLAAPVSFLSDDERASAQREDAVLGQLPVRSRWLATALLPWAATKPNDPEAPKALALLVASTRLECPGMLAKPVDRKASREAFELLHRLWPRSEWARQTKYWF